MTCDPLIDDIQNILEERHNKIACIFKCVNLNLSILGELNEANTESSRLITEIYETLPADFHRESSKEFNFHSFVISHYFISLIAEFEGFLIDILKIIVKKHPSKIGNISIKLSEISDCGNLDDAISIGIDKFINELTYKRPNEYIDSLKNIFSFNKDDPDDLWPNFIERKARRDLGVHNDWNKNEIYIRKIKEIGATPSDKEFLAPDNEYFVESVDIVHNLMRKIAEHCAEKFSS